MPQPTLLEDVANDLALWIDQISTEIAVAFSASGRAPFSAPVTEEDKLKYYRDQLFNPDGTPNAAGRDAQLQRLGSDGFAQVYKAVTRTWPDLKVPPPPGITVPDQWPTMAPPGNASAPGGGPGGGNPLALVGGLGRIPNAANRPSPFGPMGPLPPPLQATPRPI